ncbi:MAG: ACP phosphodiesterase [Microbacterium sp.]|jgi:FMN-dependent NADH-azoreductase|uniref:ACP phosphodiesterase n=1 Tax=Microbacterium ginsengisoli TaxID=400772 RepID=A0A3C1KEJ0_9MICO|nr:MULTISPECIES: NAD(P)H-dependent oxidoreductase [unclassified Microbacterium]MAL05591.1 ACP phosphodiesterase [Microbacterium sp.]MBN9197669.1 NAD(P)H-dependent oxidoreductase [Microbacterium ginsengisoli]KQR92062.1 ACP phosphodiesterase [Microbacterium sp. Leaf347]OJU79408.1 MAG: ACP phosphodiesterase [Microbacterium sp. 71-23]HAN25072.1 ACP phosphodiesterase [Microbacterium ginsengisoli]
MSLFRLDASILPATSASRALGDIVEAEWTAAHPDRGVVRRDLATAPIPATAWPAAVTAKFTPEADRSPEQVEAVALATRLADELISADALLFTVPLYNFGVSQHVKTWFDLAYTDPRIDPQGTALQGKPAVLATVLGGNYGEGTPKEGWDHSTGWLERVFADVWGLDLRVVTRPFTLVGVNPALDAFSDLAADLKQQAEESARAHGRDIASAA